MKIAFGSADTRSALTLATGGTFNRVEGVPVIFGPVFDWRLQGATRMRLDALGVFRTAGDLTHTRGDLGYLVRAELRTGETRPIALRFRAFDLIAPVEDWGLHGAEVGWAAFLFQRDYRDYYVSKGIAGGVTVQVEAPLSVSLSSTGRNVISLGARASASGRSVRGRFRTSCRKRKLLLWVTIVAPSAAATRKPAA